MSQTPSFRLPDALVNRLDRIAGAAGMSRNQLVRIILEGVTDPNANKLRMVRRAMEEADRVQRRRRRARSEG